MRTVIGMNMEMMMYMCGMCMARRVSLTGSDFISD